MIGANRSARVGVRWSLMTMLHYLITSLEEIEPKRLHGYGAASAGTAADLNRLVTDITADVKMFMTHLQNKSAKGIG